MYISPLSKKLITGIIAVTFVGVALTEIFEGEHGQKGSADPVVTKSENNADQQAIIKSLTNNTLNVVFEPQNTQSFTGYVQGAGYASFQFYATKDQLLIGKLGAGEENTFELVLFGPQTRVLKSGVPLTIPASGRYDLRVVFRNDIELQQEKEAHAQRAEPQNYHLTLTLKNAVLPTD